MLHNNELRFISFIMLHQYPEKYKRNFHEKSTSGTLSHTPAISNTFQPPTRWYPGPHMWKHADSVRAAWVLGYSCAVSHTSLREGSAHNRRITRASARFSSWIICLLARINLIEPASVILVSLFLPRFFAYRPVFRAHS